MPQQTGPKLFALIYKPGPAYQAAALQSHVPYIALLRSRGVLLQGGPFGDTVHSWPVIYAADAAAAQTVVAADPAVINGLLQADVLPWNIVFGIKRGI